MDQPRAGERAGVVAGVAVRPAELELYLLPGGEEARLPHAPCGIARLVGRLAELAGSAPVLAVIGVAGGKERSFVRACRRAEIPVALARERRVRCLGESMRNRGALAGSRR